MWIQKRIADLLPGDRFYWPCMTLHRENEVKNLIRDKIYFISKRRGATDTYLIGRNSQSFVLVLVFQK